MDAENLGDFIRCLDMDRLSLKWPSNIQMKISCVPPKGYVEVLTPHTSDCDLRNRAFTDAISSGEATVEYFGSLIQYDWGPYDKITV